jgi:hypothetical protein
MPWPICSLTPAPTAPTPVLTLAGRAFASRVCGSLVSAAGLPELVCDSAEAYVELAVGLADNPVAVASLKAKLEAGRTTCDLFNMEKLTACLEGLYADMCKAHQAGERIRPDLTNLPLYLELGAEEDQDIREIGLVEDYNGLYREKLAARHKARPVPADSRIWSAVDAAG